MHILLCIDQSIKTSHLNPHCDTNYDRLLNVTDIPFINLSKLIKSTDKSASKRTRERSTMAINNNH